MNLKQKCSFLLLLFFVLSACTPDDEERKSGIARHDINPGASANDFLSDIYYTSLKVEIVYVSGYEPTPETLAVMEEFFQKYTNKPDGLEIITRAIPPPGLGTYSVAELRQVEKENRTAFSKGKELAAFVFFADNLNEKYEEGKVTLGKAYYNTSIAIYDRQIQEITGTQAARTEYQQTTLRHEFGHLFGLVDNGSPAQSAHEDPDPERKSHCNVEGCLMSAFLDFSRNSGSLLTEADLIDFDLKCQQDLKANGGK